MITLEFMPRFLRQLKKLDDDLRDEAIEKIGVFKNSRNHKILRVHKLHGHLSDCYSFWVNSKIRIVFQYTTKAHAIILAIGDHDIYG